MSQCLIVMKTEMQLVEQWILGLDGKNTIQDPFLSWHEKSFEREVTEWDFQTRFMDPLINGDYPASMKRLVEERLPKITPEMSKTIKGAFDFLGINHYTTLYARNDRTGIRKLILQDASSDPAVITSCKIKHHFSLLPKKHLKV